MSEQGQPLAPVCKRRCRRRSPAGWRSAEPSPGRSARQYFRQSCLHLIPQAARQFIENRRVVIAEVRTPRHEPLSESVRSLAASVALGRLTQEIARVYAEELRDLRELIGIYDRLAKLPLPEHGVGHIESAGCFAQTNAAPLSNGPNPRTDCALQP